MWKGHPPSSSRHRRDRRDYAEAGYRRDYSRSISAAGSRGSATAHLQTRERLEPTVSGHSARRVRSRQKVVPALVRLLLLDISPIFNDKGIVASLRLRPPRIVTGKKAISFRVS